jgi:AraC-like DNA-binding protein
MSPRNLRRRLASEGTSFRLLIQQQRQLKVESVLKDGRIPLSTLANWLSYADASVVSRAFKTWTGVSPTHYAKATRR